MYAKNPPNKTYLLMIKPKLFNLHVTTKLYVTSKKRIEVAYYQENEKNNLGSDYIFCKYKENVRK